MVAVLWGGVIVQAFADEMGKMTSEMKGGVDAVKDKKDAMQGDMKAKHDEMRGDMKEKQGEMKDAMKNKMGEMGK